MSFPVRFSVQTWAYTQGVKDELGDPVESWVGPTTQGVYGWSTPSGASGEPKQSGHDRVVVDVELFTPESFTVSARDRVTVAGVQFEVIGFPEDYNNGPFGWRPGLVVNLRRIEG